MAADVTETELRLLERIAQTDDLQAVRVYADWLLEQGSSRAEFVEIQLRRAKHRVQPGDDVRARALLQDHWREWLGAAAAIVDDTSLRFEHGVLRDCRLIDPHDVTAAREAMRQPQLSTLRRLDCGDFPVELAAERVVTLPSLRTLMANADVIAQLARRAEKLTALLAVERPDDADGDFGARRWIRSLADWSGPSQLRSIDVGPLTGLDEIDAVADALRQLPRGRGTQTLRALLRPDGPGMEDRQIPARVAKWLFEGSTIATEGVDARTDMLRAWLLPGGDLRFSRLELETLNPYDAAKLLEQISTAGIRHVLLRSGVSSTSQPSLEHMRALSAVLPRWMNREIEMVLPEQWMLKLPG
ncbi:MAG: hypothetical protein QM723_02330 [Myxococcaceae bacterium]